MRRFAFAAVAVAALILGLSGFGVTTTSAAPNNYCQTHTCHHDGDHHDHDGNGNGFGFGFGVVGIPVLPSYAPTYAPTYTPTVSYSLPQATSALVYVVQYTVPAGQNAVWADGTTIGCPNGCYPGEQFTVNNGISVGAGLYGSYGSYGNIMTLGTTYGCLAGGYSVGCGANLGFPGVGLYSGGGLVWLGGSNGCGFDFCGGFGGGDWHDGHRHH